MQTISEAFKLHLERPNQRQFKKDAAEAARGGGEGGRATGVRRVRRGGVAGRPVGGTFFRNVQKFSEKVRKNFQKINFRNFSEIFRNFHI